MKGWLQSSPQSTKSFQRSSRRKVDLSLLDLAPSSLMKLKSNQRSCLTWKVEMWRDLPWLQRNYPSFRTLESENPSSNINTSYILQFLWRVLTFSYSIIGQHFACDKSWIQSSFYNCVMRTVKLFSLYMFRIKVLVCDGASSKLALLKVLAGY